MVEIDLFGINMISIFILNVILKNLVTLLKFLLSIQVLVKRSSLILQELLLKDFALHQMLFYMLLLFTLKLLALLDRYKDYCCFMFLTSLFIIGFIIGFIILLLFFKRFPTSFYKKRICNLMSGMLMKLILK